MEVEEEVAEGVEIGVGKAWRRGWKKVEEE